MKSIHKSFFQILFFLVTWVGNAQLIHEPIKVLIVDGFSNHDWKQTTKVVTQILEKTGLFEIRVSTAPSEPEDKGWETWNPKFSNFDVVIQNTNNIQNKKIEWPKSVQQDLEKYVRSGGGLFILHSANNAFADWREYNLMIGLGWRSKDEGIALQVTENGTLLEIPVGEGRATYHGPRNDAVIYILSDHPINNGFNRSWKTPDIELYKFARGPAQNLTVLSYAKDEETSYKLASRMDRKIRKGKCL